MNIIENDFNEILSSKEYSIYQGFADDSIEQKVIITFETMLDDSAKEISNKDLHFRIFWINSDHGNSKINACVHKVRGIDDNYCIGLSTGILTELKKFINEEFVLKTNNIPLPSYSFNLLHLDTSIYSNIECWIYSCIFLFFIMHEYAHVLCGHKELDKDILLFEEIVNDGNYDKQAKEYWADIYGVVNSMICIIPSYKDDPRSIAMATALYLASIHTLFAAFFYPESDKLKDYISGTKDHPHHLVRMKYIFSFVNYEIYSDLLLLGSKDNSIVEKIVNEYPSYEEFEKDITIKYKRIMDKSFIPDYKDIFNAELEKEYEEVLKHKEYIKYKYRNCAFVDYGINAITP